MECMNYIEGVLVAVECQPTPTLVPVPIRFMTTKDYMIGNHDKALFSADTDCDNLINSTVSICAELPRNWEWDPFKGYIYINVFNASTNTNNVRVMSNSHKVNI